MKNSESIAPQITAVFSNVDYHNIPFGHLYQLEQIGISTIHILLNKEEIAKANDFKFLLFDGSEPQTIIEHYQSQSDKLNIQVINTGDAMTEEEKLLFFLKNNKEHAMLHLFLCKESLPWVSEELRAKPLLMERTESVIPFLRNNARQKMPLFKAPCSSEKAIALLNDDSNPCLCYQMAQFDVLHYQWLFNIVVELIALRWRLSENECPELSQKFYQLMKEYNQNIIALEKAEDSFEKNHKESYRTLDKPGFIVQWQHSRNVKSRETLKENFPVLLGQFIHLYGELLAAQTSNTLPKPT